MGTEKRYGTDHNNSTVTISGQGPLNVLIIESIVINNKVPKMDLRIKTRYNSDVFVNREALIARFEVPVTEVYLKNRKVDLLVHLIRNTGFRIRVRVLAVEPDLP